MPSCVRIGMFGGLRMVPAQDGAPIENPPYRAGLLLAVLALSPGRSFTREELIVRLWPDADIDDGRRRLRQTLHELRAILEPVKGPDTDLLESSRTSVQLNSRLVGTDIAEFETALKSARNSDSSSRIGSLQNAVDLYKGELLRIYLEGIQAEQHRLESAFHLALTDLARLQAESGNLQAAVEALQRLTASDPISEPACCDLMRLYALSGRHSDVVRQYQILVRALHEDLNESPHESTVQLMDELNRQRSMPPAFCTHIGASAIEPASAHVAFTSVEEAAPARIRGARSAVGITLLDNEPLDARYVTDPATFIQTRVHHNSRSRFALFCAICASSLLLVAWVVLRRGGRIPANNNSSFTGESTPRPGSEVWEQRYIPAADERDSEPTAIAIDSVGDVFVARFVQTRDRDVDYLVLKYDPSGSLVWKAYYDGPSHDVDRARAIAIDGDGNVLVTGDSDNGKGNSYTKLAGLDYATLKLNGKTGERIWLQRYNSQVDGEDRPISIAVDSEGASYVTGTSFDHPLPGLQTARVIATVKYDKNGYEIWKQRYGPDSAVDYRATDMKLDVIHGHLFVAGVANGSAIKSSLREQILLAYDLNDHLLWHNSLDGLNAGNFGDGPARIAIDTDGSIVLAGSQANPATRNFGSTVIHVKYSQEGRILWQDWGHNPDPTNCDTVADVTIGPNHSMCVGIQTYEMGSGTNAPKLAVYSPANTWIYGMGEPVSSGYYDILDGIALDTVGNVITCGTSEHHHMNGGTNREPDFVTAKYAPNCQELWRSTFQSGTLSAMALSLDGSPVVTGRSRGNGTNDIVTIKYRP